MITVKIPVSRQMEVPGAASIERKTTVSFRHAESTKEMLELVGNDAKKALALFNAGRWAELRTKVSNALANKTPQQRAADKLIDAYKTINPDLDEAAIKAMVLSMPGMKDALNAAMEAIPAETDEAYFEKSKDEAKDGEKAEGESADAPAEAAPAEVTA